MTAIAGVGDFGLKAISNETKAYRDEVLNFVNGRFPQSLTVYVDGTSGDDARTGLTNDTNATTGRVKSFDRIASLYSGKVSNLVIKVVGNYDVSSHATLDHINVFLDIASGVTLRFKKDTTSGSAYGEGSYSIRFRSKAAYIYIRSGATLDVEAHAGTLGVGDQFYYRNLQGAVKLLQAYEETVMSVEMQSVSLRNSGTFTIGNNATFCVYGSNGTNGYGSRRAIYERVYGNGPTLGSNSTEHNLIGNRTIIRQYTPSSSTDINVLENELCSDHAYLYRKSGGTIKKIAWTAL